MISATDSFRFGSSVDIALGGASCFADSSHARIIRLSSFQGTSGSPGNARQPTRRLLGNLGDRWAELAHPAGIRSGHGQRRAEVEFENGAMAFSRKTRSWNSTDLSLNDSARTTRLVLRQGSASFYVNPASGDYFSVTGGASTVEAEHRSAFRWTITTMAAPSKLWGALVLHNKNSTRLEKAVPFRESGR